MPSSRRNSIACSLTRWRSEQRPQQVPPTDRPVSLKLSRLGQIPPPLSHHAEATNRHCVSGSEWLADSLLPFIWCGAFDNDARQAAGPSHVSLTREQTSSYGHHGQSQRADAQLCSLSHIQNH